MFLKSLIEVETLAFMSIACFILTFTHKGSGYIYYFRLLCLVHMPQNGFFRRVGKF